MLERLEPALAIPVTTVAVDEDHRVGSGLASVLDSLQLRELYLAQRQHCGALGSESATGYHAGGILLGSWSST